MGGKKVQFHAILKGLQNVDKKKKNMKTRVFYTVPAVFIAVFTLLLSGCFSPWKGKEATITITLGADSNARAATYPPNKEILPELEHRITLQGPTETQEHTFSKGETTATLSVVPGLWEITVEALNGEEAYAKGSGSVDVIAGQNNPVKIQMEAAQGISIVITANTLAEKLALLQTSAISGGSYILEVSANESIAPHIFSYSGKTGIAITLKGAGANRIVSLASNGSMFTVGSGVTLTLDSNITLQGRNNSMSLVRVNGGTLVMNSGSIITGNTAPAEAGASDNGGGGVYVSGNGALTMAGGKINNNRARFGGGIFVESGTFTMTSGEITGNFSGTTASPSTGGGVFLDRGTHTMSGGKIADNKARDGAGVYVGATASFTMRAAAVISGNTAEGYANGDGGGGGVILDGTFIMNGGSITGNKATNCNGGGVFVSKAEGSSRGGTFTMNDGEISGNTTKNGGGVFVWQGTVNMEGGGISNNNAQFGGGVLMNGGNVVMKGGVIARNTASRDGGGVCIWAGTFAMSVGTINGNTAGISGTSAGYAGGINVYGGTFTMSGGIISGNTTHRISSEPGDGGAGGVMVNGNAEHFGIFTKTGGTIYGSNGGADSNVVKQNNAVVSDASDGCGHAVMAYSDSEDTGCYRNTTAGTSDNLSFNSGTANSTGVWSGYYNQH